MNRARPIRRLAVILAGLVATLLAAPAAFARPAPPPGTPATPAPAGPAPVPAHLPPLPPGWNKHPPPGHVVGPVYKVPVHSVVGGLPGWQIILIAAGAAILAAAMAILAARARAARRHRAARST